MLMSERLSAPAGMVAALTKLLPQVGSGTGTLVPVPVLERPEASFLLAATMPAGVLNGSYSSTERLLQISAHCAGGAPGRRLTRGSSRGRRIGRVL